MRQPITNETFNAPDREKSFRCACRSLLARLVSPGVELKDKFLVLGHTGKKQFLTMTRNDVPLNSVAKGSRLVIIDIPAGRSRTRLIRLGIIKGGLIKCLERLPGGTVVIEKSRQEIAIGATLAKTILVAHSSGKKHFE